MGNVRNGEGLWLSSRQHFTEFYLILFFSLFSFLENRQTHTHTHTTKTAFFNFYDYFFSRLFPCCSSGLEARRRKRTRELLLARELSGSTVCKVVFLFVSLFYFLNEKEALPTRAMVVLCVFITLKPGSRKAEKEEKREKYSPQTDLVSCTSFFSRSCFFPICLYKLLREK